MKKYSVNLKQSKLNKIVKFIITCETFLVLLFHLTLQIRF